MVNDEISNVNPPETRKLRPFRVVREEPSERGHLIYPFYESNIIWNLAVDPPKTKSKKSKDLDGWEQMHFNIAKLLEDCLKTVVNKMLLTPEKEFADMRRTYLEMENGEPCTLADSTLDREVCKNQDGAIIRCVETALEHVMNLADVELFVENLGFLSANASKCVEIDHLREVADSAVKGIKIDLPRNPASRYGYTMMMPDYLWSKIGSAAKRLDISLTQVIALCLAYTLKGQNEGILNPEEQESLRKFYRKFLIKLNHHANILRNARLNPELWEKG